MKKIFKRLISVTLSAALVFSLLPSINASAENLSNERRPDSTTEFQVQKEDGVYLCKLQISDDMLTYQLDMTNTTTNETSIVMYEQGVATTVENSEIVSVVDYTDSIQIAEEYSNVSSRAYRSETKCIIPTLGGNNLWYQMGITGPDVGYMKMGCDWTYRVKADACDDCANFRNKIIESNSLFTAAGLSDAAALGVCVLILLAGPTGGLSAAVAAGLTGTAATTLVAACFAEQSAHDSYDIAKGYGVRQ